jgi:glycosyltransferase involved in cell wall biosynthesis
MLKVTIIMPIFNGESVIKKTFEGLQAQNTRRIEKIILIDDGSSDNWLKVCETFINKKVLPIEIIVHSQQRGLAACYNEGINATYTELFILMHQDIFLADTQSIEKVVKIMEEDPNLIAAYPTVIIPREVWEKFGFWAKCMFSRQIDKKHKIFSGKFDCIRKTTIKFDSETYMTGGEDADYYMKLKKIGPLIPSDIEVHHIHTMDKNFSLMQWMRKEAQFGEIYGTQIRRIFRELVEDVTLKSIINIFVRPLIVIGLFVPIINILAIAALIVFSIMYTKEVYLRCWNDPKILLLPLINSALLFIHVIYWWRGLFTGKQKTK